MCDMVGGKRDVKVEGEKSKEKSRRSKVEGAESREEATDH